MTHTQNPSTQGQRQGTAEFQPCLFSIAKLSQKRERRGYRDGRPPAAADSYWPTWWLHFLLGFLNCEPYNPCISGAIRLAKKKKKSIIS